MIIQVICVVALFAAMWYEKEGVAVAAGVILIVTLFSGE